MKFKIGGGDIHRFDPLINRVIEETLEKVGMGHLKGRLVWKWSSRLTSTMGKAYTSKLEIHFSESLYQKATDEQRYENIVHEVCHVTADCRNGKRCMHGPEWYAEMRRAGIQNPRRCHDVDIDARKRKKVPATCPCGKVKDLGLGRAARLQNGTKKYHCKRCKGKVTLVKG